MDFDEQAQDWDNDPKKIERAIIFAKEIIDFVQPKQSWNALEFGCGTGLLSYQLRDAFNSIMLADNSPGMMNVLQQKIAKDGIKNFKPLLIDLLADELRIGQFDVLYTLMTVHHIQDLDKVFKKFNSLVKENGYLCIADLVREDGSFHSEYPEFDGHNGFDRDELMEILLKNGFKTEHYKICYEFEKEIENKARKYPLFLMICKKSN